MYPMATLTDAANFAMDPDVRLPLMAGMDQAALDIMTESAGTANHALRVTLALAVMRNPISYVDQFVWAVSTNGTTVDMWTSGDHTGAIGTFAFVIASVWDALSGASAQ